MSVTLHQKEVAYNWSLILNRQLTGPGSKQEADKGTVTCMSVCVCAVQHEMRVRVQSGPLSHLSLSHSCACTTQTLAHTHTHTQCPQPPVTKLQWGHSQYASQPVLTVGFHLSHHTHINTRMHAVWLHGGLLGSFSGLDAHRQTGHLGEGLRA